MADFADIAGGDLANNCAAVRIEIDDADAGELDERLADRRVADAEAFGELFGDEALAGAELAVKDFGQEGLGDGGAALAVIASHRKFADGGKHGEKTWLDGFCRIFR